MPALVFCVDCLCDYVLAALDTSRLVSSTVVVFIAGHGSLLGEHDLFQQCGFCEPVVRVPSMRQVPSYGARCPAAPPDPLLASNGVLCNLADDPGELHNRYYDRSCRGEVERLMDALDSFAAISLDAPGTLVPTAQ